MVTRRTVAGSEGLGLAVTERGDPAAPTVVLVHGYPDTSAVWDPVAQRLASRLHVVTYDVRGAGASERPSDPAGYRLHHLAADFEAVIASTSPDRPVHLVGHDWGSVQGWEIVTTPRLGPRLASFTSISGPPLDHAGQWTRAHLRHDVGAGLRQGLRSWYVGAFHLPLAPQVAGVVGALGTRRLWARSLRAAEGVETDKAWPAPTFAADASAGMHLYRANVRGRLRDPGERHTDVPVQLVVARRDRFVTPAFLDGLEDWSSQVWRREVPAGHWLPRSHPDLVARFVGELIDHVEGGPQPTDLRRGADRRRTVFVTGAGSGIGRAVALAFAAGGDTVVATDLDPATAEHTAQACHAAGGRGHALALDVTDDAAWKDAVTRVLAELGAPDVLVNNAGIGMAGTFLQTTNDDWQTILDVNLWGVIHGSRLLGQAMVDRGQGGHVVTIASAAAYTPSRTLPAYATTKAAVLMLSECLRAELAPAGIGVSAVCPGFANTGIAMATRYVGASDAAQDELRRRADRAYRRRNLSPDTVAAAVVRAVERDLPLVPVGTEARLGLAASRLAPGLARRLATIDLTPR